MNEYGEVVHVGEEGGCKLSALSTHFPCKLKTALKNEVLIFLKDFL